MHDIGFTWDTWFGLVLICSTTALALSFYNSYALKTGIFDIPNSRSMHADNNVVVGAGAIILSVQLVAWAFHLLDLRLLALLPIIVALALTFISFRDDMDPLAPAIRLAAHILAAAVLAILYPVPFLQQIGLPAPAATFLLTIAIAWFINLYNFMDGIDGITGVETLTLTLGFVMVTITTGLATPLVTPAIWLAGGMIVFLFWNWHPARMLLGDAGSIPLGFLTVWLMLELARHGYIAAAIILPMYYLVDGTVTLIKRMTMGEQIWKPHRQHAYQRAVLAGGTHPQVTSTIACLNVVLIVIASISPKAQALAISVALILTVVSWVALPNLYRRRESSQN